MNRLSVHGGYTNWGGWTECDVTCGGGHRQRSRACTNPVPEYGGLNCTHLGNTVQSDVCNTRPCAREYYKGFFSDVDSLRTFERPSLALLGRSSFTFSVRGNRAKI